MSEAAIAQFSAPPSEPAKIAHAAGDAINAALAAAVYNFRRLLAWLALLCALLLTAPGAVNHSENHLVAA